MELNKEILLYSEYRVKQALWLQSVVKDDHMLDENILFKYIHYLLITAQCENLKVITDYIHEKKYILSVQEVDDIVNEYVKGIKVFTFFFDDRSEIIAQGINPANALYERFSTMYNITIDNSKNVKVKNNNGEIIYTGTYKKGRFADLN